MRKKICMLLIILCLGFIWVNSFFPADVSGEMSGFAHTLLRRIFGEDLPITEGVLRKLAHGTEYAAFGILAAVFIYEKLAGQFPALGFCGLGAAVLDETIQLFSDGRAASIKDVWIDFGGFTAGVMFILFIKLLFGNGKGKSRGS